MFINFKIEFKNSILSTLNRYTSKNYMINKKKYVFGFLVFKINYMFVLCRLWLYIFINQAIFANKNYLLWLSKQN